MWDLSSPTRDQTCAPCSGRQGLNHWTATEFLRDLYFITIILLDDFYLLMGLVTLSNILI